MNDYILFLDSETSDKPRAWKSSTFHVDKWPYLLQLAWSVHKKNGELVLVRDFYIYPGEIEIHEDSLNLHGITLEFLKENGQKRRDVLQTLMDDLQTYNPLIVGHFIQFDLRMLEVGFNRVNLEHNLQQYPKFCTMLNSRPKIAGADARMLRLNELYFNLFNKTLKNQHNARVDALATKDCFFELIRLKKITPKTIHRQQKHFKPRKSLLNRFSKNRE